MPAPLISIPMTADWLKQVYLPGVDFSDDSGELFHDALWVHCLSACRAAMASLLDLQVDRAPIVNERHDFTNYQWGEWSLMTLYHRPVFSRPTVQIKYGDNPVQTMPPEWTHVQDPLMGQIQLVPSGGDMSSWPMFTFATGFWGFSRFGSVPGFFNVSYMAGWDLPWESAADGGAKSFVLDPRRPPHGRLYICLQPQAAGVTSRSFTVTGVTLAGATVTETVVVPAGTTYMEGNKEVETRGISNTVNGFRSISSVTWTDSVIGTVLFRGNILDVTNQDDYHSIDDEVLDVMGKMAACYPLVPAGNLLAGAGVASSSQGTDGVNRSTSTTSSPENLGYSAQIRQYERELRHRMPLLRRRFQGMQLAIV